MRAQTQLHVTLRHLAELAEIRGASGDASDLLEAAAAIEALGPDGAERLGQLVRRNRLSDIPNLHPRIHARVRELVRSNTDAVAAARRDVPELIAALLDLGVLTSTDALVLVRDLDVATIADLEIATDDGRLEERMGTAIARRLEAATVVLRVQARPMILGRAFDALEAILPAIAESCPALADTIPAGDVRRYEPLVRGIVLVGRAADPSAAIDQVCAMKGTSAVLRRSARRAIVRYDRTEIDIHVATHEDFGSVLVERTGSREHLKVLRPRHKRAGARADEHQHYAGIGLTFIPPELRQGSGEVEAASIGAIPSLITREQIRGDLHMHSTYSDGRETIAVMAETCHRLGYEYIAITDHSERAAASRTLSVNQIGRQRQEIDRVRERFPRMTILHGIEVDIMPDGGLDFSDAALVQFDIVLASLHDSAGHGRARLTERCLRAVRHPLVNVITHPANQLVGARGGYDLDFDAIYAAATETGTLLEIDGAPGHLDLDGEHARAAIAAGVTVVIDSDCHRADRLDRQMRMGVGTARRGWVEPRHVLNARPLTEVLAFIARKRGKADNMGSSSLCPRVP